MKQRMFIASSNSRSRQKTTRSNTKDFEGEIPQEHCGAGTVTIWDRSGLVVEYIRGQLTCRFTTLRLYMSLIARATKK
ncbi:MAG: hypothetical protein M8350_04325 [Methanosarcinaceae archaeon]|nr:hypothetical protein [Methanosarcinaceae archaeon]